jgi:hypothetical protein
MQMLFFILFNMGLAPVFSVLSKKSIYIVKIGEISFGIFF